MNTKMSKGLIGITLAFIMITSIFAAITPAPVIANPGVVVDGVITGTEWDDPLIWVNDTVDAAGTAPPGYNLTEVRATVEGNTLYCLMVVDGMAGDADGNNNPDTVAGTDYPGIGAGATFGWEEYNFYIDADNGGTNDYWLRYTNDTTYLTAPGLSVDLGATTAGAFSGSVIEVSLANADTWINVDDFCVAGAADTDNTGAEDYSDKACYTREFEPPEFNFTSEGVGCLEVEFTGDYTVDPEATIVNHTWNFGDGSPEVTISGPPTSANAVTHTFNECGPQVNPVTIYGYDSNDLYGEFYNWIDVACPPTASAIATPSCYEGTGSMINFTGYANPDTGVTIVDKSWTFSDGMPGSSDDEWSTSRLVNDTVTATFTVIDSLGCEANATVTVGPCSLCNIRIYGTYDHGAGKLDAVDPHDNVSEPENKPYSDPQGPFYPQSEEAPRKDFITFNPAIMDANQGGEYTYANYELSYSSCDGIVQVPAEKVWKRMWYEKEWFKDFNGNGEWDIVTTAGVMTMAEWEALDQWDRPAIIQANNPEVDGNDKADIYGPAIIQEFTYMTLGTTWEPTLIQDGGEILIPLAHDPNNPYRGLNSFDADGDGVRDPVRVESEKSLINDLGTCIDKDGKLERMNENNVELDGDEQVVFVLGPKDLSVNGGKLQFFDHVVSLHKVSEAGDYYSAQFLVEDNEGGSDVPRSSITDPMQVGDVQHFYRAKDWNSDERPAFYLKCTDVDYASGSATVEVGRMFGQTYANLENNPWRAQKMMIVDQVFYNVVAIKAEDDCFKYITFRQKLPKVDIKIFGKHLKRWDERETLPEMPPYNQMHEILVDINPINSTRTPLPNPYPAPYPIVKIPTSKKVMPPLDIFYVAESHELRYKGELKEIYNETYLSNPGSEEEYWNLEWYWTLPWQYTEFRLPKDDRYLVTLSWWAPESEMTLWDHQPEEPVGNWTGERFKFWYEDCTGPLYIDRATGSIRIYGTFGEGAGDPDAVDPVTNLTPENKPYTDPVGPFFPQHDQAPNKDFMTFNPAIMDHNQGYPELDFVECDGSYGSIVQVPKEKVFKRMWYEKEWFKDFDGNGSWDVVIEKWDNTNKKWVFDTIMTLEAWNAIPDYQKLIDQRRIKQSNNPEVDGEDKADIYGPAIVQEFTYMTVDTLINPIMVKAGSELLIPMAHDTNNPYRGLNSFDADGDGVRDAVRVESEQTLIRSLGHCIDQDGDLEAMNSNATELDGDEQVVFVLGPKELTKTTKLQFFDYYLELVKVSQAGDSYGVSINVKSNSGGGDTRTLAAITGTDWQIGDSIVVGDQPIAGKKPVFYVKLLDADYGTQTVTVEVGRMFGQTHANSEVNPWSGQKVFIVDGVFYNVVAVKTQDNCFKYITFRQKLPKVDIKLFGKHLVRWDEGMTLPELPPFNEVHEILVDVQAGWGDEPECQQDKVGPKSPKRPPLNITYVEEEEEWRFLGELKEIYNETQDTNGSIEDEYWNVEWFHTQPMQYTAFVVPDGELYLMTLAWYAPQAEITLWDHQPDGPVGNWTYDRVKFWYDPLDNTDIYINRVGDIPPVVLTIADYYNMPSHGGDSYSYINTVEVINAVYDYLTDAGPFAPGADPAFTKTDLLNYVMQYLAQPEL